MEHLCDISEVGGNGSDKITLEKDDAGRILVVCETEGGYNSGSVDLMNLLVWVINQHPELLTVAKAGGF